KEIAREELAGDVPGSTEIAAGPRGSGWDELDALSTGGAPSLGADALGAVSDATGDESAATGEERPGTSGALGGVAGSVAAGLASSASARASANSRAV